MESLSSLVMCASSRKRPMPSDDPCADLFADDMYSNKSAATLAVHVQEYAEGFKLHCSASNKTGYKGVCYNPGKCPNKPYRVAGPQPEQRSLGYFATALEAAIAYAKFMSSSLEEFQASKKEAAARAVKEAESQLLRRGVQKEIDGVLLHLSCKNSTGYKGVSYKPAAHPSKPYHATGPQPEGRHLGYFTTAVGAARAYARFIASPADFEAHEKKDAQEAIKKAEEELISRGVVTEAGGYRLHLSAKRQSGYLGVRYDKHHPSKPWKAEGPSRGQKRSLGYHASAIEAAVAYAKFMETLEAMESTVETVSVDDFDADDWSDNDEQGSEEEASTRGLLAPQSLNECSAAFPSSCMPEHSMQVPPPLPMSHSDSDPFGFVSHSGTHMRAAMPTPPPPPPQAESPTSSSAFPTVFDMTLTEEEAMMLMRDICDDHDDVLHHPASGTAGMGGTPGMSGATGIVAGADLNPGAEGGVDASSGHDMMPMGIAMGSAMGSALPMMPPAMPTSRSMPMAPPPPPPVCELVSTKRASPAEVAVECFMAREDSLQDLLANFESGLPANGGFGHTAGGDTSIGHTVSHATAPTAPTAPTALAAAPAVRHPAAHHPAAAAAAMGSMPRVPHGVATHGVATSAPMKQASMKTPPPAHRPKASFSASKPAHPNAKTPPAKPANRSSGPKPSAGGWQWNTLTPQNAYKESPARSFWL